MGTSLQTLGHPQTIQIKGNPKAESAQIAGGTKQQSIQLLSVGCGRWEHLAPPSTTCSFKYLRNENQFFLQLPG